MWIAFSAKFLSTNFLLSTNYDLKTANIPWQCPFNNLNKDRRHCQSIERIL